MTTYSLNLLGEAKYQAIGPEKVREKFFEILQNYGWSYER